MKRWCGGKNGFDDYVEWFETWYIIVKLPKNQWLVQFQQKDH
jgi:hypothetical protein